MSTFSYRVGSALGTVTREFLRAVKQSKPAAPAKPPIAKRTMPAVAQNLSDQDLEHMYRVPAIVRLKQVDLNAWYEANTREVPVKAKKPRTRKPKAKPVRAATNALRLGSLNELIAPIEPSMNC